MRTVINLCAPIVIGAYTMVWSLDGPHGPYATVTGTLILIGCVFWFAWGLATIVEP